MNESSMSQICDDGWTAIIAEFDVAQFEDPSSTALDLELLQSRLWDVTPALDARGMVDQMMVLRSIAGTVAALQAEIGAAFEADQLTGQRAVGVSERNLGRGIAEQVGLARRMSPSGAARQLARGRAWADRLPATFDRLRAGETSERAAQVVAEQTSHLDRAQALAVDAELAPHLAGWNVTQTEQAVRHAAYTIDPQGWIDRRAAAEQQRRVWTRPAPDCMAIFSALLPAAQAVAMYASLRGAAVSAVGTGDERGLGQVMADTLVQRVTGQATADAVPVEVQVTLSADTLFAGGNQAGHLRDYGAIPAAVARDIATGGCQLAPNTDDPLTGLSSDDLHRAGVWLRRVLTDPITGIAVDVDTRRRLFDPTVRRFIQIRDRTDRFPYSSAPIRHIDHVDPVRDGGPTSIGNAQGTSARYNYTKDMPGWNVTRGKRSGEVTITTPTGHRYTTLPPPQLGLAKQIRPQPHLDDTA